MKAGLTPTEIIGLHTTQMTEALLNIGLEKNSIFLGFLHRMKEKSEWRNGRGIK
jgi:hypothetical protein